MNFTRHSSYSNNIITSNRNTVERNNQFNINRIGSNFSQNKIPNSLKSSTKYKYLQDSDDSDSMSSLLFEKQIKTPSSKNRFQAISSKDKNKKSNHDVLRVSHSNSFFSTNNESKPNMKYFDNSKTVQIKKKESPELDDSLESIIGRLETNFKLLFDYLSKDSQIISTPTSNRQSPNINPLKQSAQYTPKGEVFYFGKDSLSSDSSDYDDDPKVSIIFEGSRSLDE